MWTISRSEARRAAASLLLVASVAGLGGAGCASSPEPEPAAVPIGVPGPRLEFDWTDLDGKPISTASLADRESLIAFVASFDMASQAQVRVLASLAKRHVPRINLALLFLEAPENQPLVEAYVHTLALPFPAALADAATIAGTGPFSGLHHVPSVVLLDRQGREAWRHVGLCERNEIEQALRALERRDGIAR
jgi:hypothetical protein